MAQARSERTSVVIGPLGEALTLETLPPADQPIYWVARRKAQVVAAVRGGLLSVEEACERYGLSLEEFATWNRAAARSGVAGLRATHSATYRKMWSQQEREAEELRRITRREGSS